MQRGEVEEMKNTYEELQIDVIEFESVDVITASSNEGPFGD